MSDERIRVALLGMNERSLALMKMFFEGAGRHHFLVVEERHAKAGVFDLDAPGAEKLWGVYHRLYDWPSIVLSVRERRLPKAIWVQKPVLIENLAEAAERLDQIISGGVRRSIAEPTPAETATTEPGRVRPAMPRPADKPASGRTRTAPDTIRSSWTRLRELSARQRGGARSARGGEAAATATATKAPASASRPVEAIRQPAPAAAREPFEKPAPKPASKTASKPASKTAAKSAAKAVKKTAGKLAGKSAKRSARKSAKKTDEQASAPGSFCRENLREASPGIRQYVGAEGDLDPRVAEHRERMFYAVRGHFQATLDIAWRKARDSQRRVLVRALDQKFVLFCPQTGLVTTNFGSHTLRSTCVMTLSRGDLRAELLGANVPTPDDPDAVTVNADTLLWNVALWTSKGRLPQGTDLHARVHLRHWPNFTRLTRTPHAMRIAALWAERGAGLLETSRLLGVPQRYVFAVYSASQALGLLRLETPQEVTRRAGRGGDRDSEQAQAPEGIDKHRQRSLFSRLLRRFTG